MRFDQKVQGWIFLLHLGMRCHKTLGVFAEPTLLVLLIWNSETPYFRLALQGRPTARDAVGSAGLGGWKKRMPGCNGLDRGLNVPPPETVAHVQLVSDRVKTCKAIN